MIVHEEVLNKLINNLEKKNNGTFILFGDSKKLKIGLLEKLKKKFANIDYISLIDDDNIPIDKIRYMLSFVRLKSESRRFVVVDLDVLNLYSVNSMLKTLEEPPGNCFFFLLKSDSNVLPTILSRSVKFYVNVNNSRLLEYLIKTYFYPLNWAEFVISLTNSNFDFIDYFSNNFWDPKDRKPKENFIKIVDFLFELDEDLIFYDEFWTKNFNSFLSFRVLLKIIKSFLRDICLYSVYDNIFDSNTLSVLEKNFIYLKILGREKFFNSILKYKHRFRNLDELFKEVKDINSNIIFKRMNKKILYIGLIYKLYNFLRNDLK
ncbi:MAG: hypothetical protein RMJ36_05465 [Candidatus Calescibacterium sp.]|nr:hypothetical protein [Candidatus Calescibacterium sp.]MDW8133084.1 hypothetical protein [Candidatus Calescibacterium sp.]